MHRANLKKTVFTFIIACITSSLAQGAATREVSVNVSRPEDFSKLLWVVGINRNLFNDDQSKDLATAINEARKVSPYFDKNVSGLLRFLTSPKS